MKNRLLSKQVLVGVISMVVILRIVGLVDFLLKGYHLEAVQIIAPIVFVTLLVIAFVFTILGNIISAYALILFIMVIMISKVVSKTIIPTEEPLIGPMTLFYQLLYLYALILIFFHIRRLRNTR